MKNKKAVAFLSGSAGELDWILPILDHLSNLQFEIKEDFCFINSSYGEIKLKISSFINIFLSPYNDSTWSHLNIIHISISGP